METDLDQILLSIKESTKIIKTKDKEISFFELKSLVFGIFQFSEEVIAINTETIKDFLKEIICMDKCTGAYGLYKKILNSNFPFAEEILLYAVENEPSYNNDDDALVCYLLKILYNTNDSVFYFVEETKMIGVHHCSYKKIYDRAYELGRQCNLTVSEDLRKKIVDSFVVNKSNQGIMKAIAFSLFFEIFEVVPILLSLFKERIGEIVKIKNNNSYRSCMNGWLVNAVEDIALALNYFTDKDKVVEKEFYSKIYTLESIGLFELEKKEIFNEIFEVIKDYSFM